MMRSAPITLFMVTVPAGPARTFPISAGAPPFRTRPAHAEIIHGPVHRQFADVTSREKQRTHHMRIGGKRETSAGDVHHGPVVLSIAPRPAKGRAKNVFDQVLREPASPSMADRGLTFMRQGNGQLSSGTGRLETIRSTAFPGIGVVDRRISRRHSLLNASIVTVDTGERRVELAIGMFELHPLC